MLKKNTSQSPTEKLYISLLDILVEDHVLSRDNADNKKAPPKQSEIVVALMNEGIPGHALAKAIAKRLNKPLYDPATAIPTLRGDGWVLAGDTVYVVNPFDNTIELLMRRKQLTGTEKLGFTGFGILPYDALEAANIIDLPYDLLQTNVPISAELKGSQKEIGEQLCEQIMAEAIKFKSSDIHMDPRLIGGGQFRFRIDGQLVLMGTIQETDHYESVVNVFLAKTQSLNPGEFTEPKDGSFKWPLENREINVRLSLIPVSNGSGYPIPKLTLRLLGLEMSLMRLASLGMNEYHYEIYKRVSRRTQGLVLVTGPTGSGKSTTLFANMRESYDSNPNRSYYTVEDPVEVVVPNFYQIEINERAGMTFPNVLRALLRADPDVILIGEIRDSETARLAVQASLTGHLVFSTLHTNGALDTVPRLLDLGIDPRLLSDSLIAVSAQRIARKVCKECAQQMPFSETPYYKDYSDVHTYDRQGNQVPALQGHDMIYIEQPGSGCTKCEGKGYKGRHLIAEVFTRDTEIQRMITNKSSRADILEYLRQAQNFREMWYHGLELVKTGVTTFSELETRLDPIDVKL